jgi:hypothetical protein
MAQEAITAQDGKEMLMRPWRDILAVVVVTVVLWSGAALAQTKQAGCDQALVPPTIDGQVVKVDPAREKVTVRATDGTKHEFQASKETLQDFKPGDRITAKLRKAPPC